MSMTINKALKEKNRLIKLIETLFTRLQSLNSVEEGAVIYYDAEETYAAWLKAKDQLIALKTQIHTANIPVYDKIFRMSEIKDTITRLKKVSVLEGKHRKNEGYGSVSVEVVYKASMNKLKQDERLKAFENELELLQEALDQHNATKTI
jgi:hypothetical protein